MRDLSLSARPFVFGFALTLAGAALVPAAAHANSCTVQPTVNLVVGTRPTSPSLPGAVADPVPFTANYQIAAMHDAECSNMTESGSVTIYFAATPTQSAGISPDSQNAITDDMGTVTYKTSGAHLLAQIDGSCACGILGGPSGMSNSNDIVVPVTIQTGLGGYYLASDPTVSQSMDTFAAEMTVASGAPIRVVGATWGALLTTGESATEVAEYPDGTRSTHEVAFNGTDHSTSGAFQMDINRAQIGDVKLYVEFEGTRSNVLTLHVTSGGGGDGGTSGGDDAGTSSGGGGGGCSARPGGRGARAGAGADVGALGAIAFAVARMRRRRTRATRS